MHDLINFFEDLSDREFAAATAANVAQERITRLENAFVFAKLAFDERRLCDTAELCSGGGNNVASQAGDG